MVSTGPTRATSSGVTISGQAPCWAFVARTKQGILPYSGVEGVIVVVDPGRQPRAEPVDEGLRLIFSKPPPEASEAKATSSTTTRPRRALGFGSLRGVAKASSGRDIRGKLTPT